MSKMRLGGVMDDPTSVLVEPLPFLVSELTDIATNPECLQIPLCTKGSRRCRASLLIEVHLKKVKQT
jgi:hypothetical protein